MLLGVELIVDHAPLGLADALDDNLTGGLGGDAAEILGLDLDADHVAELGVGSIVSPKELCSNDIARYVRAMQNTTGAALLRCTAWWRARQRRWNSAHPRPRATWARHFGHSA